MQIHDRPRFRAPRAFPWLLLAAALVLGGCRQSPGDAGYRPPQGEAKAEAIAEAQQKVTKDREFYRGTRAVQQDIRDLFARVEGSPPHEWNAIARKLVAFGEPAVPQMMANLGSYEESTAVMAAYCLGMIQDPRSLDALAEATASRYPALRYEAATAMLRMGDRRGLPTMIRALEDEDPLVRGRAILVLRERTGSTMDYTPDGKPQDRAAAVARWRAWYARGGGVTPAPRPRAGATTR